MLKLWATSFFAMMLISTGFCQDSTAEFSRVLDVPVFENELQLKNPWAGGLNYVQYSKIDLDLDGTEDLFLFDRSSNKILTFINTGGEGELSYDYAPEYESIFPSGMKNWVLLRDYNCDGLKDVFTSGPGGMRVYEQGVEGDDISFEAVYSNLIPAVYDFGNPYEAPAYNIAVDLPHIGDIDDDGDLDILTFSDGSLSVFYYINNASDDNRCDTLALELANRCYGFIAESSENNTIFLEHECDFNVINPRTFSSRPTEAERDGLHTGGTLLSLDTNGDGYLELVIGDITNDSLIMVTNGPSVQGPDSMIMQAANFPANFSDTEKINFFEFPGAYHEDFNNDGIRDLVSSSFSSFSSIDDNGSWLYLNEGADNEPSFELLKKDWLQDEMIENGTNAMPILFDYNADGLSDLIVAHRRSIITATEFNIGIRLYENIGTETSPSFELRDENWLDISSLNLLNAYPAFADLDNDGDEDMVLGESTGVVHYFENSAGPGNPVQLSLSMPSLADAFGEDIDPGQDVIPQLIDIDEDGLIDLILSEQWGNINFYKNTGTPEEFQFELVDEEFGGVWVDNLLGVQGNNVSHFYKDTNDEWALLTGNELGTIHRWGNIENNLDGNFLRTDSALANINDGQFSAPFLNDINGDSFLDLFVGNERGGITLYYGEFVDNVAEVNLPKIEVNIFPNPANDFVNIQFVNAIPESTKMYDSSGRLVWSSDSLHKEIQIDLKGLDAGFYFITGHFNHGVRNIGKLLIE